MHQVPTQVFGQIKRWFYLPWGYSRYACSYWCSLVQQASSVKRKYSEVHNLAFQGPSWDVDKKFGTEPIAQERCFTKSSRWLTVLSGCPRTPRGTPFVTWTSGNCQDQILLTRKWTRLMANSFLPGVSTDVAEYLNLLCWPMPTQKEDFSGFCCDFA